MRTSLSYTEKQILRQHLLMLIQLGTSYGGVNTRTLVQNTVNLLRQSIPQITVFHCWGMLSHILRTTNYQLNPRRPGFSLIV